MILSEAKKSAPPILLPLTNTNRPVPKPRQRLQTSTSSSSYNHRTTAANMPAGELEKPTIVDNRDGTISLKYDPKSEGNYEMQIKYNSEHIKGSPYKFIVDNTSKGLITAFGP